MEPEIDEERNEPELDKKMEKKIKKTVRKILEKANMYKMTEKKVRDEASAKLDLDLSRMPYKPIVRQEIESFLTSEKDRAAKAKSEPRDAAEQDKAMSE